MSQRAGARPGGANVSRVTNVNGPAGGQQPNQPAQPHNPYAQQRYAPAQPARAGRIPAGTQEENKELPWYVEIPVVVVLTLLIMFVIQTFIGRLYVIPSASMEPTLHGENGSGDRIFVEKVSYYFSDPEPGDVIVFAGTDSWNTGFDSNRSSNPVVRGMQEVGSWVGLVPKDENTLVKRIIATGGQTVSCQAGDPAVMVDGKPIDQSYTLQPNFYPVDQSQGSDACGGPYFGPVTVPEGHYFMMGDNRTNSLDSRAHMGDELQGTIPEENIRGKVKAVVFPLSRMQGVDDPDIQQ
ncbi:signal peptidase I [Corynebacterium mucifaciens]|uniref:Signal peptidase I n=1 Tax=Corynebacterium mucifaciens TaxID=57171 RepID=A0A7X6LQZ1_9CORY|nr:signal peptidase I [Corynebacterium mucifaciens]NKY68695.1 signal peptidase I [Corynebacterium mucifaciens]